MKFIRYEDAWCFYIWKPAWFPSTFWKEKSFLEFLFEQDESSSIFSVLQKLKSSFSEQDERGLLNRLDTATSGLLYFAKSPKIKAEYKKLQAMAKVQKYYLLEVYGDLQYWTTKNGVVIDFPIAHHKDASQKMIVLDSEDKKIKADFRVHYVQTKILESERDQVKGTTTLIVTIQKWIRHQIRSHFSAIGYPIVGDDLYGKKKDPQKGNLQLFSIGIEVKDSF